MKPAYKMTALSPYPGKGLCLAGRAACCTRPSRAACRFYLAAAFRSPRSPSSPGCDGCVRLAGGRDICDPINS